jgi:hypothetical protein
MLTEQQVVEIFVNKIGETPEMGQIEEYKNYTADELTTVLDRAIAINQDPTFCERVAEDYKKFMAATHDERLNWKFPEPIVKEN